MNCCNDTGCKCTKCNAKKRCEAKREMRRLAGAWFVELIKEDISTEDLECLRAFVADRLAEPKGFDFDELYLV